jgi:hypothetical protein
MEIKALKMDGTILIKKEVKREKHEIVLKIDKK